MPRPSGRRETRPELHTQADFRSSIRRPGTFGRTAWPRLALFASAPIAIGVWAQAAALISVCRKWVQPNCLCCWSKANRPANCSGATLLQIVKDADACAAKDSACAATFDTTMRIRGRRHPIHRRFRVKPGRRERLPSSLRSAMRTTARTRRRADCAATNLFRERFVCSAQGRDLHCGERKASTRWVPLRFGRRDGSPSHRPNSALRRAAESEYF